MRASYTASFLSPAGPVKSFSRSLAWIHLAESETGEEHLRFVDHAELFGNGQDEVLAKLVSLETQTRRYVIFRRTKNGAHWEQIFRTEPSGCSSRAHKKNKPFAARFVPKNFLYAPLSLDEALR